MADAGKTFAEATQFCQDNHSTLVAPQHLEISDIVMEFCNGPHCWIGLACDGTDDECETGYDHWKWTDGSSLGIHNLFTEDSDEEIKGAGPGKTCASTDKSVECGDGWVPQLCSEMTLKTMCLMSSPPPPTCDGGEIKEHGNWRFCYAQPGKT